MGVPHIWEEWGEERSLLRSGALAPEAVVLSGGSRGCLSLCKGPQVVCHQGRLPVTITRHSLWPRVQVHAASWFLGLEPVVLPVVSVQGHLAARGAGNMWGRHMCRHHWGDTDL